MMQDPWTMVPGPRRKANPSCENKMLSDQKETLCIFKVCMRETLKREFSGAIKVNRGWFGTAPVEGSADVKIAVLL